MPSFLPSFFQVRKPRGFTYKPLYYNEREEYLNKLKKEAEEENIDLSAAEREVRLREKMELRRPQRQSKSLLSTKQILIFLGILILLIAFLLK